MSAIVGIYYLDGRSVERSDLEKMTGILAHRGPDGEGIWHRGSVGLGHRMLWTTPESLIEKLPLENRSSNLVITADARIDNRDELIATLNLGDQNPAEITDTDLILFAYEKWGEQCPEKLLGDFAFAIWDQGRHKLFCARDPMAVKPFFYHHSERLFIFGSSIAAILQHPKVPRKLNELKLAYFLARIYDEKIITFYKNIVRLPGAHCLTVEDGRCRIWQYWKLDPEREIRMGSNDEYEEAMREVFFESVRCRLRSAFPVGSMLSGGLDSSSIVCTAMKIIQNNGFRPLHTFSAIFPERAMLDARIDERKFMEAVSSLGSVVQHDVIADRCSPLLDILWNQAEPIPAPNFYMDWLIFRNAQRNGMRVMLSGHDGDTIIAYGYELFAELARKGRWLSLFRELKAICNLMRWPLWGVIRTFCLRPLLPEPAISAWRFLHGRKPPPMYKGLKLNKTFSSRVGLEDHLRLLHESKGNSPRLVHMEHITAGILSNMNEMLGVAADDSAIDLRFPYFDRRLIEFCMALPLDQKLQNGESRSIMRRSMKGVLPSVVRSRFDKGNLSSNFNRGLLENEKKLIKHILNNDMGFLDKYIDTEDLKITSQKYMDNPLGRGEEAFNIFLAVTLIQWMKRFDNSV